MRQPLFFVKEPQTLPISYMRVKRITEGVSMIK